MPHTGSQQHRRGPHTQSRGTTWPGQPQADQWQQRWQPPWTGQAAGRKGRLLDAQRELRKRSVAFSNQLFEEYVQGGASSQSLANVLSWAERMRRERLDSSPLVNLLERVNREAPSKESRQQLVPALYEALLSTDEAKLYLDRAELFLPAIALAFQLIDPLPEVESTCKAIRHSLEQFNSPDRFETFENFLSSHFIRFIHRNTEEFCRVPAWERKRKFGPSALKIVEMASALRQTGCCPTPLADSINWVCSLDGKRQLGPARAIFLYHAFFEEPEERKQFADRPHIFFPWLLQQLRHKNTSGLQRVHIFLKLFNMHTEEDGSSSSSSPSPVGGLPPFMLAHLLQGLPHLFDYATHQGDFGLAQRVWDFDECSTDLRLIYSPHSLLKFSLHHWLNGRQMHARVVHEQLQERLHRVDNFVRKLQQRKEAELGRGEEEEEGLDMASAKRQLGQWRRAVNRLNDMNKCFRQLMANPKTVADCQSSEKYSEIFLDWMRDFLREGSKI